MSRILIIGGGVIGLSIAREFHKKGFFERITILEKGSIGQEASNAAAGMLAPQAETDRADLFFNFCNESSKLYPNLSEELLDETGIDIEFDQSGTLYITFNEKDVEEIRKRYEWEKKAGLEVEHLSARETHKLEPFVSPDSLESLFFPNDWQVENRKLLKALRKYAELNNIEIIEQTEVTNLITENGKIKGVETSKHQKYFADTVILATGAWTSLIKHGESVLQIPKVKPIRGQMLSFQTAKRLFTRVIYSPRGYIVPRKFGRILAGATVEDVGFENKNTESGIEFVRRNAIEISPSLANLPLDDKWSGLRPFAADGLPILGEIPDVENLFVATAHYRNGILLAPLTAKVLAEKIADGKDSEFLNEFGAKRFNLANAV
ncbi:MAG: glycine oxidase ThiO [Aridibacter sp.]